MKRLKKIGVFLLSICMLVALIQNEAFAASARVSVSSASGNVGNTVTITCTAAMSGTSIGAADITLQYEPSALTIVSCSSGASSSSGSVFYSQNVTGDGQSSLSFTVSFKILKEGTYNIAVTNADVWSYGGEQFAPSTSGGSVTGKAVTTNNNSGSTNTGNTNSGNSNTGNNNQATTQQPENDTKDKNSKLSALQVYPGTLAPAFSANTTAYTVTVPEGTTEVTISATAQSSKANVSVSGGKDLLPGSNEAKVVVTAENGSTTVYNLTIMCGEEEKEIIQVNGADNTINEVFTDDTIPAGFVRDKATYNGKEYVALKHEKTGLQLVSLLNESEEAVFYIYNQETQEFYNFVQIQISEGKYIIPLPLSEIKEFADNELAVLTLQDKTFDAWKIDEEYSVLPALTSEGEELIYQYDSVDGTFQRYAGPVTEEVVEEIEETEKSILEEYYLYIIIGLAVLIVILAIALIYFIATRKHRHQARKRKAQKKMEKLNKEE